MASKILLLGFFTILAIFATNTSALEEKCVETGEICHEHHECCNQFNKCYVDSFVKHTSSCRGDGLLGGSCRNSIDCSKVKGSTCANGTCECLSDHTQHDRHLCQPIVKRPGIHYVDRK